MNARRYLGMILVTFSVVLLIGNPIPGLAEVMKFSNGDMRLQGSQGKAGPPGTPFTYQGFLTQNNQPYNGSCDLRFGVWDAEEDGSLVSDVLVLEAISIDQGYFSALLDFGLTPFNGDGRWLEIEVSCPPGSGYTLLGRQAITSTPYALYARQSPWEGLLGIPAGAGDVSGTYPNLTVIGLQDRPVGLSAPQNGWVLKWDGVQWIPDEDQDTTYTAGAGLIQDQNIFSVNFSTLQMRVYGTCTGGSSIRQINTDGSVVCEPISTDSLFSTPQDNTIYTVDNTASVGEYTSITIGADGLGLISYWDRSTGDLKAAHCNNMVCSSVSLSTVDGGSGDDVGTYSSITIGSDKRGLISYYDSTNHDLKVAHCDNLACSSALIYTIDSGGDVGLHTSITVGADGLGLISYFDNTNNALKVAHCSDLQCSFATTYTIDNSGDVGYFSSIALGADGLGLVSYYDLANGDLKFAHCDDLLCSTASISTYNHTKDVGLYPSITVGRDGLGLVSFLDRTDNNLMVIHCEDRQCSTFSDSTLENVGDVVEGGFTSLTIGADGLGIISYYDQANSDLKVAHCDNLACSSAITYTIDGDDDVGMYASITLAPNGFAITSYYDMINTALKAAHCANTFCIPFWHRR